MIAFSLFFEMKQKSDRELKKEVYTHQTEAQKHHDALNKLISTHGLDKAKKHPDFLRHFTNKNDHIEKAKSAQAELDKRNKK